MPLLFDATRCSLPLYCYLYASQWRSAPVKLTTQDHKRTLCHASLRFVCICLQAQLIAQSIGQAFSVAYQEFLRANGINPEDLSQKEYSDIINTQEMYNDDLIHFSNSENCKEVGWYNVSSNFFFLQMFVSCLFMKTRQKHCVRLYICGRNYTHAAGSWEKHISIQ